MQFGRGPCNVKKERFGIFSNSSGREQKKPAQYRTIELMKYM